MENDAYAHIGIKRAKRTMVTKVILFGVATVLLTGQLISSLSLLVGPGMFPTMVGMLLMTNIIPIILLIVCVWRLVVWLKALNTPPSQDHGVVAEFNTTTDDDDDTTTTHILQLDNGKRVDLSDKLSSIFQGDDETRKRLITPPPVHEWSSLGIVTRRSMHRLHWSNRSRHRHSNLSSPSRLRRRWHRRHHCHRRRRYSQMPRRTRSIPFAHDRPGRR